jgi:acylpyruvate hydrolase
LTDFEIFSDHITELSSARPSQPFFFLKPPSSILLPASGPLIRPKGVSLHHEIELGLIIGPPPAGKSSWKNMPNDTSTALSAVSGYLLTIDMTARNVQNEAKKKGLPWSIAKGFDTFLPVSNVIAKEKIPDPHDIEIYLSINGEDKQRDSTNLMLFNIPWMLSDISQVMALEEGDLVLTGTPKGVGPVVAGDKLKCGLLVGGKELEEASLEVECVDQGADEPYEYRET